MASASAPSQYAGVNAGRELARFEGLDAHTPDEKSSREGKRSAIVDVGDVGDVGDLMWFDVAHKSTSPIRRSVCV